MAVNDVVSKPVVIMEDEIVHDEGHPFCDDPACPCHTDFSWDNIFYLNEHCEDPFDNGLLTVAEKDRLYWGKQI